MIHTITFTSVMVERPAVVHVFLPTSLVSRKFPPLSAERHTQASKISLISDRAAKRTWQFSMLQRLWFLSLPIRRSYPQKILTH